MKLLYNQIINNKAFRLFLLNSRIILLKYHSNIIFKIREKKTRLKSFQKTSGSDITRSVVRNMHETHIQSNNKPQTL